MPKQDICKCAPPRCVNFYGLDKDPFKIIVAGNVRHLQSRLARLNLQGNELNELLAHAITKGKSEFRCELVRVLIENGANPNSLAAPNKFKTQLHLAMELGLHKVLKTLLAFKADPSIRSPSPSLNSGLHWVIIGLQRKQYTNEEDGVNCIQIFLENCVGEMINKINGDEYTAVHLACILGYWKIASCLIKHGANIDHEICDTTARALVNETSKNVNLKTLIKSEPLVRLTLSPDELMIEKSRNALKTDNEEEFVKLIQSDYENFKSNVDKTDDIHETLLQIACHKGQGKAVKELIAADANVNLNSRANPNYPVFIAITEAKHDILKSLLESEKCDLGVLNGECDHRTALHIAALKNDTLECFDLLLEYSSKRGLDINAQDDRKFTALHYAARNNKYEMVKKLLSSKANIFIKSGDKLPAFFNVRKNDLEEYLNTKISIEKEDNGSVLVNFNYDFIVCDRTNMSSKSSSSTNKDTESPDQQQILKHSDDHVDKELGKKSENMCTQLEMAPLEMFADSPEHKSLLKHPIFRSFLHIKWHNIRLFFYFNFLFYLFFTITITWHVFSEIASTNTIMQQKATEDEKTNFSSNSTKQQRNAGEINKHDISWWLSTILLIFMVMRELFQLLLSPTRYILQFENWIEIFFIVLSGCMLAANDVEKFKPFSASVILFIYIELLLLTGRLPLFSMYIIMYFKVLSSFVKLIFWYSLIIIGFSFSFYILFTNHDEKNENYFFTNTSLSLFKTILMATGDFETGTLNFNSVANVSHIILVLFVFLVVCVLMNLLTGLAVCDIQTIQEEATLHFCIQQVKFYSQIEAVLLGGSLSTCLSLLLKKIKIDRFISVSSKLESKNDLRFNLSNGEMKPDLFKPPFAIFLNEQQNKNMCKRLIINVFDWFLIFNRIAIEAKATGEKNLLKKLEEEHAETKRKSENEFNQNILKKFDELYKLLESVLKEKNNPKRNFPILEMDH